MTCWGEGNVPLVDDFGGKRQRPPPTAWLFFLCHGAIPHTFLGISSCPPLLLSFSPVACAACLVACAWVKLGCKSHRVFFERPPLKRSHGVLIRDVTQLFSRNSGTGNLNLLFLRVFYRSPLTFTFISALASVPPLYLFCTTTLSSMVRPSSPSPAPNLYFFHPPLLIAAVIFSLLIVMSSKVQCASAAPDSVWTSLQAARPHLAAGAVARFVSISAL